MDWIKWKVTRIFDWKKRKKNEVEEKKSTNWTLKIKKYEQKNILQSFSKFFKWLLKFSTNFLKKNWWIELNEKFIEWEKFIITLSKIYNNDHNSKVT